MNSATRSFTTDLDLASYFSSKIGKAYYDGVEFMSVLPAHSLVRFRDAIDLLCIHLGSMPDPAGPKKSQFQNIGKLLEAGKIDVALSDTLHAARKLCIPGAHALEADKLLSKLTEPNLSSPQEIHEALGSHAGQVRRYLLEVFKSIYKRDTSKEPPPVDLAEITTQQWKALVSEAITTEDADDKYRAALWCESEVERLVRNISTLVVSDAFATQLSFLRRLAGVLHRAAHELDPNPDANFRYAVLVEAEHLDLDRRPEAQTIIEEYAKKGHPKACHDFGVILHERKDFVHAKAYWLKAVELGYVRGYLCLYLLHDGVEPGFLKELGLEFLRKGVERGDLDSVETMGRKLFEGDGVGQDQKLGTHLLEQAAHHGHVGAKQYLTLMVNGGANAIATALQRLAMLVPDTASVEKKLGFPGLGMNDQCGCKSGKKYKKCCRP